MECDHYAQQYVHTWCNEGSSFSSILTTYSA